MPHRKYKHESRTFLTLTEEELEPTEIAVSRFHKFTFV